jgi:hypothetical protein
MVGVAFTSRSSFMVKNSYSEWVRNVSVMIKNIFGGVSCHSTLLGLVGIDFPGWSHSRG